MTTWNPQANKIFIAALEIEDVEQRLEYLNSACASNVDLRVAVDAMLVAHQNAEQFLRVSGEGSDDGITSTVGQESQQLFSDGTVLAGKYLVKRPLGQGGMGVVLLAEQQRPVRRLVAIKLIKSGLDARDIALRFDQERHALAMMDHPNIAKFYDAGIVDVTDGHELGGEELASNKLRRGIPYFAMEYISGAPITDYCDRHRLGVRARLELFIPICQAVQHAHQKGIVHRDLKPTNILVETIDNRPVARVIDFGVAKVTGAKLTEASLHTSLGSIVGTLEYMSPEQAQRSDDIDTRSDVYALGAVLYELLVGSVPHGRDQLQQAGLAEMLRIINEETPVSPSSRLSSSGTLPNIALERDEIPQRLIRSVRGDLDWIVLKALEKERDRRYDSVTVLAEDVRRFLDEEPVAARPPSAMYRLHKAFRRHRGAFLAAGLAVGLLIIGVLGTSAGFVAASRNAKTAREETAKATAAEQQVRAALVEVEEQRDEAETQQNISTAISSFLVDDLLQQANVGVQANRLLEFGRSEQLEQELKRNPTLLELVDRAVSELAPDRIEEKFPQQPVVQAMLLKELGFVYNSIAEFGKAQPLLRRSLKLFEVERGASHESTLAALRALAFAVDGTGQKEEALGLVKVVLERSVAKYGEHDERTLRAMLRLAKTEGSMGRDQVAIQTAKRVVELCSNETNLVYSDELEELKATAETALCIQYMNAGKYELTVEMLESAYEYRLRRFGAAHPITLNSGVCLAGAYHRLLQLDKALPLYEKIVPRVEELFGPDHPKTFASLDNLASCYHRIGNQKQAVKIFEDTLLRHIARHGPHAESTLRTMANLGVNLLELGRLDEAIDRLSFVREHAKYIPKLHWAVEPLNRALVKNGQVEEAEQLCRERLEFVHKEFADRPDQIRAALFTLILNLFAQEKYADSEPLLREIKNMNAKRAPENWNSFNAQAMLGKALMAQSKLDEAEPLLLAGYEGMKQRRQRIPRSVKHHLTDAAEWLVELYETRENEQQASEWRKELELLKTK